MPLREAGPAFVPVPVPVPAREPAPDVSPPVQQVIYDQRPFIPLRYLDPFYGDKSLSERKIWWEEYLYIVVADGWTRSDKCRYLKLYLQKSALAWYKQLGDVLTQWSALKEAFRDEFLTPTKPTYDVLLLESRSRRVSTPVPMAPECCRPRRQQLAVHGQLARTPCKRVCAIAQGPDSSRCYSVSLSRR